MSVSCYVVKFRISCVENSGAKLPGSSSAVVSTIMVS